MIPITPSTPQLSTAKQELLAKRLHGRAPTAAAVTRIPRRPGTQPAPLSFSQQRLWFVHQLDPASAAYHLPISLRLLGPLQFSALERALQTLVERHKILRTTFAAGGNEPVQVISPARPQGLPVIDLCSYPPPEREHQARQLMQQEVNRSFDLVRGPLIRWQLLRMEENEHILLVTMHHIIADGWSVGVWCREMQACYHAFRRGREPELPELPIQYADYADWQRQWLQGERLETLLAFWRTHLAGAPAELTLPTDQAPGFDPDSRGASQTVLLPRATYEGLLALARRGESSPFMVLLSALAILLGKWTRQDDLVLGTVVAGRNRREVEPLLGCFMNFLPLRIRLAGAVSGLEVLTRVKATVLEAYAHQDCPFDKIVQAINPVRQPHRNPLYNVGLLLQNYPANPVQDEDLTSSFIPLNTDTALLDLRWVAEETPEGLSLTCEYATALFDASTITQLVEAYQQTIQWLVREPDMPLAQLPLAPGLRTRLESPGGQAQDTLAVAATFTVEPVAEPLQFWLQTLGLDANIRFAPYNQLARQLLDPASLLATNTAGVNVVLARLEDLAESSMRSPLDATAETAALIERNAGELLGILQFTAARHPIPWLVCLCPPSQAALANSALAELFRRLEDRFQAGLAAAGNVYLTTSAELLRGYPTPDYDDPEANRLGHMPYTQEFYATLGTWIIRHYHALRRSSIKVVAMDCDQTLWSGVCGEDGPAGIQLDDSRLALQQFMLARREAGMLLCLCSKNNEADVLEVFRRRAEMPLRLEHFAARRLNWRSKSENLRSLAGELGLGLDSFVLVDDNPVECAEVEANCPEVLTIQLPENPAELPRFLAHLWAFDQLKVTAEDRQRAAMYQQNRQRAEFQSAAPTFAEFLAGLNLEIQIEPARPEDLARAAQLTQRTNQFNCTTLRRSEEELPGLMREHGANILVVRVTDRFGDYGLVGLIIHTLVGETLAVDTFLLSCRVLGKGVEHRMLAHLGTAARQLGARWVDVPFRPTAKNQPAFDFLNRVGAPCHQSARGGSIFHFPAETAAAAVFDPQTTPGSPPARQSAAAQPAAVGEAPAFTFKGYGWIARQAREPGQILKLIATTPVARPAPVSTQSDPVTETQRQLCEIWRQLLRLERVGVREDFFALGGDSHLAVRLFVEIEKTLGRKLPLATLFKSPTVEQLAEQVERAAPPVAGENQRQTSEVENPVSGPDPAGRGAQPGPPSEPANSEKL